MYVLACLGLLQRQTQLLVHKAKGWSALRDNDSAASTVTMHAQLSVGCKCTLHLMLKSIVTCQTAVKYYIDSCLLTAAWRQAGNMQQICFAACDVYNSAHEGITASPASLHTRLSSSRTAFSQSRSYLMPCFAVQVDLTKVWLTMSSIIVALSFSFSNSIMNLFNSVILLFVVHPFDVGDALLITTTTTGTGAADYCVVEELSLVVCPFQALNAQAPAHLTCCLACLCSHQLLCNLMSDSALRA